ncbi:sigma-70 family RNA polymerase sigma factor [Micromonospora cathayae]|uniref:Sigma-70 family RNA polymerase sigma factor n=1 Tax=Micromonospora cathayae TaxID=3028804 RepID=A0ABY7ZGR3_9ACTN|nr:sigma-70 family RNA polymerase sigma factor [Micromonospora sp. HUAS 3]WDZ82175.1 sigma-70 family RNA polymerase sigma factor [Micromonospora sp. HUAS 3]
MDTAAQDDRALVEAVRRGERAGLEGMYRRYADRLYTYARVLVREPEAAADAVHDAFLAASRRIDQLRDPDRLRPWLYTIVRNECLRQLRERSRSAPLEEAAEPVADTADSGTDVNTEQVRDLVHTAAAALNPGDREVVHLAIRHDLSPVDIGAALGVPAKHAHARLSRARAQLERALGALLVARSGTRDCPDLAGLVDGWEGRLTPTLRKRVARHIDHCAVCGLLRREQLSPAALLSAYTAPGFLVVSGTVWSRLADAAPTDSTTTDSTTTDGSTDGTTTDGGPEDTGTGDTIEVTGPADGNTEVTTAADGDAGPADGSVQVRSSPDVPAAPSTSTGTGGSTDGAAGSGRSGEPGGQPTPAPGEEPATGSATKPIAVAVGVGGAALPRSGDQPVRVTSAATHVRRRRRRMAVAAGLLALLALTGIWALAGQPAGQVAATSGAAIGDAETSTAAAPASTTAMVTTTNGGTSPATTGPTAPAPGTTGSTGASPGTVAPGTRPGPAPTTAPGTTVVPTTAAPAAAPTVARPTSTPPPVRAFTVTASAHVRCAQDTYSLVVRATGSAPVDGAQVRWAPAGAATSTQAMTVDGSAAQATVGRLRASALTWSVRMTAADGRTAQSPTYQITDPCLRPG